MISNNMKRVIKFFTVLLFTVQASSYALESTVQVHKVDQSGTYGFSVGATDSFFKQRAFNWAVTYNRVQDINIEWNNDTIDFSLDTIDFMLSYRYFPKSYNAFMKSLTFEFQAGAGVVLTENKFNWPDLNEERFFSEQGDINSVVAFLIHKKLSKETSMHIGIKHYTDYSNFNDVSSVFIGFNYHFGRQVGY